MRIKTIPVTLMLMLAIMITHANAAPMPTTAGRAAQPMMPNPGVELKGGMDKLITFMRQQNRPNQVQIAVFLDKEIAPYFDFQYMAKSAGGNTYAAMSAAQRAALAQHIKEQFLTTLAQKLTSYENQKVRYLAQRVSGDQRTAVAGVAIISPRSYPARLDFRFYKGRNGWKVFDVVANGQSAVVYFRRQFRHRMMPATQQRSYSPGYPYRR